MSLGQLLLDWKTWAIALGAGGAAVVALLLLRRILGWVLGPIFVYETTRLARKGHTFWLRCAFALGMLLLLYLVAPNEEAWIESRAYQQDAFGRAAAMRKVMANFAAEFSNAFLLAVATAVTLATPLYMATIISEEKEKRSIDFLLATHLTNYEIVIGKLAARLLNLFGILLGGLPILALTQFWGGVDLARLLEGAAVIVVAVISSASVAAACSVRARRTRNAVILAYLILLLLNLLFAAFEYWYLASPVAQILRARSSQANAERDLEVYGSIHLAIAGICLIYSLRSMRRRALQAAATVRRVLPSRPKAGEDAPNYTVHPMTVKDNPPIGDNPLVWKERYLGRTFGSWALGSVFWTYLYLIFGILAVVAVMTAVMGANEVLYDSVGYPMRIGFALMAAAVVTGIGLRRAASITREREQQTLVSLLTMPGTSRSILVAKWCGTLFRWRRALIGLAALGYITGLTVGILAELWIWLPVTLCSHIWFAGNLGLFLSVFCRSTNRACSIFLAIMLTISGVFWIAAEMLETPFAIIRVSGGPKPNATQKFFGERAVILDADFCDRLNLIKECWNLTTNIEKEYLPTSYDTWGDPKYSNAPFVRRLIAIGTYSVGGLFLWFLARLRFRREGSRV